MARAVYAEHAPPSTLPALHASTRLHAIETHAIVAQVLGQTAFLWDGRDMRELTVKVQRHLDEHQGQERPGRRGIWP